MILKMRQERKRRNWKLQEVADKIGVTKATVHDLETGRYKPSYEILIKLEDLFKKSHRWLFAVADDTDQSQLEDTTKFGGLKDGDYKRRNAGNDKCGSRAATGRAQQQ